MVLLIYILYTYTCIWQQSRTYVLSSPSFDLDLDTATEDEKLNNRKMLSWLNFLVNE